MSEATQPVAGAEAPPEVAQLPEEITTEDFDTIIEQNRVERGEAPAPNTSALAPEAASASEAPPAEEQPNYVTATDLKQIVGGLMQWTAGQLQQRSDTGSEPTKEETKSVIEEGLSRMAPDDPDGVKDLTDMFRREINNVMDERLKPVVNQVANVESRQAMDDQKTIRAQYESHLDGLLDSLHVTSGFDRSALKAQTTQQGMEKHGNSFSLNHASQLLRELNNQRLRERHASGEAEVDAATQDETNTPPVTAPQSGDTARATQVMNAVKDPRNRSMDFRGGDFQKMVKGFLDSTAEKMTGG